MENKETVSTQSKKNMFLRLIALDLPGLPKSVVKVSGKAEAGEVRKVFARIGKQVTYDKKKKVVIIG